MTNRVGGPSTTLEDELLRCCARVSAGSTVAARIETLVSEPLDWKVVLRRSWWHRIRPLTYRHLRAQPDGRVPGEILLELAKQADELSIRNQRLAKGLTDVARLFEHAEIRGLIFKGPTLAEDAYGDVALRECGDLDLLIHSEDFAKVEAMLRSHGFRSWWDNVQANRQAFACEFERSDVSLDVHWHLAPGWLNYRVGFDSLWASGAPLLADGNVFRKLLPEDSVSVLCIHGTKHWWERLRWICDVAELVNQGLIVDWDRVETSAQAANALRSVQLGLWLANDLLDAALPEDVAGKLARDANLRRLGAQVGTWLENAEKGDEVRKLRERFSFRMGVCERLRDRIPQLIHYLLARPSSHVE